MMVDWFPTSQQGRWLSGHVCTCTTGVLVPVFSPAFPLPAAFAYIVYTIFILSSPSYSFYVSLTFHPVVVSVKGSQLSVRFFLAPILNFILFYSYLSLNIKVLYKNFFDCSIIKGNTIVQLILRLSGIDFSLF